MHNGRRKALHAQQSVALRPLLSRPKADDPLPRRVGESVFRVSVILSESPWVINFKNLKEY